ncbi:MAG: hypothetical protein GWP08_09250 [Nitrospiraceae bacterium]|nr:hypothetical protein [Nitrospiraceae bacterium]
MLGNRHESAPILGDKALRAAINNDYERAGQAEKTRVSESTAICQCMQVTDHEIEEAVLEGVRTFDELQERTKISSMCGKCEGQVRILIHDYIRKHF